MVSHQDCQLLRSEICPHWEELGPGGSMFLWVGSYLELGHV